MIAKNSPAPTRFLTPTVTVSRMRLDRALSVGLMHPASQLLDRQYKPRIPILMYHGVRATVGERHPYFETNTSPALFAEHMEFLAENGYTTVNLHDAVDTGRGRREIEKCVVITFDDGYRDFYTEAYPVLRKHDFKATVFAVSSSAEEGRAWGHPEEFMSWRELREISSHGMQIGSHTATHPQLYSLQPPQIEDEIRRSKDLIEEKIGAAVHSFAYPFAFPEQDKRFVHMMTDLLQRHGYSESVCTTIGRAHRGQNPFFLPRLPVNSYDDLRLFDAKLNGGYDWLHWIQYSAKRLKGRFS